MTVAKTGQPPTLPWPWALHSLRCGFGCCRGCIARHRRLEIAAPGEGHARTGYTRVLTEASMPSDDRGENWPAADASLAVGAAFLALWFWLLPWMHPGEKTSRNSCPW